MLVTYDGFCTFTTPMQWLGRWPPPVFVVQMSEEQLVGMLERINESNPQKTKITMQRRRAFDDD